MEYFVKRVDVLEWTGINRAELVHTGWLEPEPIRAWAQLCHDGENLYVRMEAEETPVRATLTGVLDQVCDDSCLEFFFAPDSGDSRYFNFEFNPLGALNLGFGGSRPTRIRQIVKKPEELFSTESFPDRKRLGHPVPDTGRIYSAVFSHLSAKGRVWVQLLQVRRQNPTPTLPQLESHVNGNA